MPIRNGTTGTGPPVILAFGGLDPTGGAGIVRDAQAAVAAGGYGACVPSCLTLQTTRTFSRIVPIPRAVLARLLASADRSFRIGAVKVGMVGTRGAAEALGAFLQKRPGIPVVLDPVLRSSSGGALLARDALPAYRKLLLRASVITPNLSEAEKILARRIGRFGEAILAARDIASATGAAVLLKGGHFPWKGRKGTDIAFEDGHVTLIGPSGTWRRRDAHGTGCALASALAARLAAGDGFIAAARTAKRLVESMMSGGFRSAEGRWTLFVPPVYPDALRPGSGEVRSAPPSRR